MKKSTSHNALIQTLSHEWFDCAFHGALTPVPTQLRIASEQICREFKINGICDPTYIANVIAVAFGVGDGCSSFSGELVRRDASVLEYLEKRLKNSYSRNIPAETHLLMKILFDVFDKAEIVKTESFRYGLASRPAGIGAIPKGKFLIEPPLDDEAGKSISRFGVIVYERSLTDVELYEYELWLIPDDVFIGKLVEKMMAFIEPYADRYLEISESKPVMFQSMILGNVRNLFKYRIHLADKAAFSNLVKSELTRQLSLT